MVVTMTAAKGFRVPPQEAVLNFDGTDWEGMRVVVDLSTPLSVYYVIGDASETQNIRQVFETFAERVLVEWNLEDAEGPIPPSSEGMARALPNQARAIIEAWMGLVADVPGPLEQPSSNGNIPALNSIERGIPSQPLESGDVPA